MTSFHLTATYFLINSKYIFRNSSEAFKTSAGFIHISPNWYWFHKKEWLIAVKSPMYFSWTLAFRFLYFLTNLTIDLNSPNEATSSSIQKRTSGSWETFLSLSPTVIIQSVLILITLLIFMHRVIEGNKVISKFSPGLPRELVEHKIRIECICIVRHQHSPKRPFVH